MPATNTRTRHRAIHFRANGRVMSSDELLQMVRSDPNQANTLIAKGLVVEGPPRAINALRSSAVGQYVNDQNQVVVGSSFAAAGAFLAGLVIGAVIGFAVGYSVSQSDTTPTDDTGEGDGDPGHAGDTGHGSGDGDGGSGDGGSGH